MNSTNLNLPAHEGKRGRPRNSFTSHCDAAEARKEKLLSDLRTAKLTARRAAARRAEIVGEAALQAVTNHPDAQFRRVLIAWLRDVVTKPSDRAEIAALLIEGGAK